MSCDYQSHKLTRWLRGDLATWEIYDDGCIRCHIDARQEMYWFGPGDSLATMRAEMGDSWGSAIEPVAEIADIEAVLAEVTGA